MDLTISIIGNEAWASEVSAAVETNKMDCRRTMMMMIMMMMMMMMMIRRRMTMME